MKERAVAALIFVCLALVAFLANYAQPRAVAQELGDPLDTTAISGFAPATFENGLLARRMTASGAIRLPLADSRGAHHVSIRLRSTTSYPTNVLLTTDQTRLVINAAPELRTYHLLTEPVVTRTFDLHLDTFLPGTITVDQVAVYGRGGQPPLIDLLIMLGIALSPAFMLILTTRLPLGWSLLLAALLVLAAWLLPPTERRSLLNFGLLLPIGLAGAALIPACRRNPVIALIVLGGALLRSYALGWGNGWAYHPDEQALINGTAHGIMPRLSRWSAALCAMISGDSGWNTPWGSVLLGRAWSVVLGSAIVVLSYILASQLLRRRWALLATAYVAIAPIMIQQSHLASAAQLGTLLALVLAIGCTGWVAHGGWRSVALVASTVSALLTLVPQSVGLILVPLITLLLRKRWRHSFSYTTMAVLALGGTMILGRLISGEQMISIRLADPAIAATADAITESQVTTLPYAHALFNVLLWSTGPLLMQLGLFGWIVALAFGLQYKQRRVWLPLTIGMGAYFLVVGRGPQIELPLLMPLVPTLSITAALLLQTFALRLPFYYGQRTVRLLAGTAFVVALMSSMALINAYRAPDPRIAASRWLLAHAAHDTSVAHDRSAPHLLPVNTGSISTTHLPASADSTDDRLIERYVAPLGSADYLVLGVERHDVDVARLMQRDPTAACYYDALFSGRLGFAPRQSFRAPAHIGGWTLRDQQADAALRIYDHPSLRIWQRVFTPTPQALDQMLHCTLTGD